MCVCKQFYTHTHHTHTHTSCCICVKLTCTHVSVFVSIETTLSDDVCLCHCNRKETTTTTTRALTRSTREEASALWFPAAPSQRFLSLTLFDVFFLSVISNCQFRSKTSRLKTFTANQLDEIKDPSGLFYILPFQKVSQRGGCSFTHPAAGS